MHSREGISFGSFIKDSINYQNEEVYALYGIIFFVLAVICTCYYQYSLFIDRQSHKSRQ